MKSGILSLAGIAALVVVLAGWSVFSQPLTFDSQSKIWVEGTSTVRSWTCEAGQFTGAITGDVQSGVLAGLSATTVTIPVARMDCGGNQITSKMRDALKVSSNPNIQFALTDARVGSPNNGRFAVETSGRLTIAGVTRDVRFIAEGRALADGGFRLTGSVPVLMTNHGVSPPTAMLGTLRSGDEVTVRFDVIVRS